MPEVGYANQPTTARQPEVSSEMERLASISEQLDKGVQELEQKLNTVLAQRAETGQNSAGNPEPVRVPLAQAIHERAQHLATVSERIQSIINRLEV
jgi:hypothetical protein